MLSAPEYHRLLSRHLLPMLAGATLEKSPIPGALTDSQVITESAGQILVRPDIGWPYCFRISRAHPFEVDDTRLALQFVRALNAKLVAADQPFFEYLVDRCAQEVVADVVKSRIVDDNLIPWIVSIMQKWAAQTYEGSRVSATIAIDSRPAPRSISNIHVTSVIGRDYSRVLGSGSDTMLVLSPSGHVVERHVLSTSVKSQETEPGSLFAPLDYTSIAAWARRGRLAIALNPFGELLVFNNRNLRFAYRRGTWFHFAHRALVERMKYLAVARSLQEAVYVTCLDISFERAGGCIAIATPANVARIGEYVGEDDLIENGKASRTKLFRHLIGQPFQKLHRRVRLELASLDGAIVLSSVGTILAAGAIVRVQAGSDGGGRRAAAKALSRLGFSVKISEDGGITSFTKNGTMRDPEVAFEVGV